MFQLEIILKVINKLATVLTCQRISYVDVCVLCYQNGSR